MSDGGPKKKRTALGFHFIAGLGSGVASAFLLQPADLLKTRVQQSRAPSLRHAFRDVLDGPNPVRTLWRGTTPSVIRTGVGSALYFGMLNQMRLTVARMSTATNASESVLVRSSSGSSSALPKLSNLGNLFTGALARVAAGTIMNPLTVLKVRYESTQYSYTSLASAARDVVAREGFRGFFAGVGATAVRDAPYAGLYVLVYEQAKAKLGASMSVMGHEGVSSATVLTASAPEGTAPPPPPPKSSMSSSATVNFASGVIAAVSATAMTNPFDAIKTRLQLAPERYRNLMQAATTMLREEGVRSMFSGLSLRIGRKALSSALTWTVYEEIIRRAETAMV